MTHKLTRRVLPNGHKAGYNILVGGKVVGIAWLGYYETWKARTLDKSISVIGVTRKQAVEQLLATLLEVGKGM